jgi:hypothetical protein
MGSTFYCNGHRVGHVIEHENVRHFMGADSEYDMFTVLLDSEVDREDTDHYGPYLNEPFAEIQDIPVMIGDGEGGFY